MKLAVIDGQGGGMGKAIVVRLRQLLGNDLHILALGTNALATGMMLKAGANQGASGENAIVYNANKVDIIIGSVAIITANSMLGELTPKMAHAIGESHARKYLIPLNKCNITIIGVKNDPLPHYIEQLITCIKNELGCEQNV